jgi:hypothetical protein
MAQNAGGLGSPVCERRLIATLVFDSATQPNYVGLRATTMANRRLLFQAENIELDLEVAPMAGDVSLAGQVTAVGPDLGSGTLRLTRALDERVASLDQSGWFKLDNLTRGVYRLEVALNQRLIQVPVLPL